MTVLHIYNVTPFCFQVKARIPSTLQPLDDDDEQRRAALRRSREAESEKWDLKYPFEIGQIMESYSSSHSFYSI